MNAARVPLESNAAVDHPRSPVFPRIEARPQQQQPQFVRDALRLCSNLSLWRWRNAPSDAPQCQRFEFPAFYIPLALFPCRRRDRAHTPSFPSQNPQGNRAPSEVDRRGRNDTNREPGGRWLPSGSHPRFSRCDATPRLRLSGGIRFRPCLKRIPNLTIGWKRRCFAARAQSISLGTQDVWAALCFVERCREGISGFFSLQSAARTSDSGARWNDSDVRLNDAGVRWNDPNVQADDSNVRRNRCGVRGDTSPAPKIKNRPRGRRRSFEAGENGAASPRTRSADADADR